MVFFNMLVLGK